MDANSILARSQQRTLQFACAIPQKPEMSKKERETLKEFLTKMDPELFQLTEEPVPQPGMPKPHFVMARQYSVGALSAKAPSFIFGQDGMNIIQVVRIGTAKTGGDDTLQNAILNKKMRELLVGIQEAFKKGVIRFTRVGKVFEFVFGPFTPEEKKDVLKGILSQPDEIVGFQGMVTRLVKRSEDLNVTTSCTINQVDLMQPLVAQVKVDINNRHLQNNMEARNIDQIFTDADSVIQEHLEWLFGGSNV